MAIPILRDLRGLRVQVIHPPDDEGVELVEHLRRIGCTVEAQWPIPDAFAPTADIVLLTIDYESREVLQKLFRGHQDQNPTLLAIVGYESPSTLAARARIRGDGSHRASNPAVRPSHQPDDRAKLVDGAARDRKTAAQSRTKALRHPEDPKSEIHFDGKAGTDRRGRLQGFAPTSDGKARHRRRHGRSQSSTQTSYCNRVQKVFSFFALRHSCGASSTTNDVGSTRLGKPERSQDLTGFFCFDGSQTGPSTASKHSAEVRLRRGRSCSHWRDAGAPER